MNIPEQRNYYQVYQDSDLQQALAFVAQDIHALIDCVKEVEGVVEQWIKDTALLNRQGSRMADLEEKVEKQLAFQGTSAGAKGGVYYRLKAVEEAVIYLKGGTLRVDRWQEAMDRLKALEERMADAPGCGPWDCPKVEGHDKRLAALEEKLEKQWESIHWATAQCTYLLHNEDEGRIKAVEEKVERLDKWKQDKRLYFNDAEKDRVETGAKPSTCGECARHSKRGGEVLHGRRACTRLFRGG